MNVTIKNPSGTAKLSTEIYNGSTRRYEIMKEDYILLKFSLKEAVQFSLGDGIDDTSIGLFELTEIYKPEYNPETGGYDYNLRLDAYYWKWKNKMFFYTPEQAGREASWNLTATLDVHLDVFLRNLNALGYKYRGTAFTYSIDQTVENKAKLITYDSTNLIDALNMMAETWECEWWVTDNVIHFGKCEFGDPVTFEMNGNVLDMKPNESQATYATRIYAFGSERNIPHYYRKSIEFQVTSVDGRDISDDNHKLEADYFPQSSRTQEAYNVTDTSTGTLTGATLTQDVTLANSLDGGTYDLTGSSVKVKLEGTRAGQINNSFLPRSFRFTCTLKYQKTGGGDSYAERHITLGNLSKLPDSESLLEADIPLAESFSTVAGETISKVWLEIVINPPASGITSATATFTVDFKMKNEAAKANTTVTFLSGANKDKTYEAVYNPESASGDEGNIIRLPEGVTAAVGDTYTLNNLIKGRLPSTFFSDDSDENVTLNGVVQKRLMLPVGIPYIDAYEGMTQEEAVEEIVIIEDIYPKRIGTLSDVHTRSEEVTNDDGTTETVTYYRYKDTGLDFSTDYIIPGNDLHIIFQSGKMNGMEFEVIFNPEPQDETRGSQLWEIVRNDTYGRMLPDEVIYPSNGDTYILTGFDTAFVSDAYMADAEEELYEKVSQKYVEDLKTDPSTYDCEMSPSSIFNGGEIITYEVGQKVNLVNPNYFGAEGRQSRIIGFEYPLDIIYDHPVYIVGEKSSYSRIGELEDKVDSLTFKGNEYHTTNGGGTAVYVISENDKTKPSDSNVFSAKRALAEFLSSKSDDTAAGLITFMQGLLAYGKAKMYEGLEAGTYNKGTSGAAIDAEGAAELASLLVRGIVTLGNYVAGKSGGKLDAEGISELLSLTLRGDLKSDNFKAGVAGEGYELLKEDANGNSYLEIDNLFVRMKAMFTELEIKKVSYAGGNFIFSPAGIELSSVEDTGTAYRCYFENDDGSTATENLFRVNDLVFCQTFNIKAGVYQNVGNRRYWRAVTAVGDNWFDLSKTDCEANSDIPQEGDSAVVLGNKSDATRQNAIIISVYGEGSPSITQHAGIKTYSLTGTEKTRISPNGNYFTGDFTMTSGKTVNNAIDEVDTKVESVNTKLQTAINDLAETIAFVNALSDDLEAVKNQADGAIETWFYDPVPTLTNEPAVNWTTDDDKNVHLGDLYYDGDGKSYRFQKNGDTYVWNLMKDTDITLALQNAAKAQDTADGKRRVFVTQPTNASTYDVGDLWVNATYGSYTNELLRCVTAKAANSVWSIDHWTKASKYTDDTKATEALNAAISANTTATEAATKAVFAETAANQATTRLNNWAADNVISPAEKQGLKDEIARIDADKSEITTNYTKYGLGTPTSYNNAHTAYRAVLVTLSATTEETIAIPSDFSTKQSAYYTQRTAALTAIAAAAKDYADEVVDSLQIGGRNLIINTKTLEAGTGIIYDGDKTENGYLGFTVIHKKVEDDLGSSYYDVIRYTVTDFLKPNTTYTLSFYCKGTNCFNSYLFPWAVSSGDNSDGDTTTASDGGIRTTLTSDWQRVWIRWTTPSTLSGVKHLLPIRIYKNTEIWACGFKFEEGNKATDWTPAPEDVEADIQAANDAAQEAQEAADQAAADISTINTELDKMTSDSNISPIEKTALKQQQADVQAEYSEIIANATRYGVSVTAYQSAYNSANTALTKYTASSPEYITVGSDFANIAAYYTARKTILDAIAAAAKKVADDAAKSAAAAIADAQEAFSKAEDALDEATEATTRLNNWAADNVISPAEKQGLKDEIARIDADKSEITTNYTKYGLGTPTSYNNAHTAYRAVLVTLSATTEETIAIPSDFSTKQSAYYTQRTAALTSIAAAAKDYADEVVDNIEVGGRTFLKTLHLKMDMKDGLSSQRQEHPYQS